MANISIVTSCFDCEKFLPQTIESIRVQKFPDLQYILVDGGSTDRTALIASKYSDAISMFISEPDEGMYHGIQKGLLHVTGEIVAWLNCDDVYLPWTFSVVDQIFSAHPEVDWLVGQPAYLNPAGQCIKVSSNAGTAYPREYIRNGWFRPRFAGYLQQESMFWRRSLLEKADGLDLRWKYAADFELWTRFAQHAELYSVAVPLAAFRKRPGEQKSSVHQPEYEQEVEEICRKFKKPAILWRFLSSCGELGRVGSRLIIWKNCRYITYDPGQEKWIIQNGLRPLSRYSFPELLQEQSLRRKAM